jgi:bleomycin hydrolase
MYRILTIALLTTIISFNASAQDNNYKVIKQNKSTSVKNQQRTGTCWCFSTISFLESELLRTHKGEFDLSEMYIIRNVYPEKARYYVQLHGNGNFTEGGQAHDVIEAMNKVGLVPESEYPGNQYAPGKHNHSEMAAAMKGMLDGIVTKREELTPVWNKGIHALLDVYLGENIASFPYNGTFYSPRSFAMNKLGLNANDYVEIASYSHHPYYSTFSLEVPDNWSHSQYYNVPIDDMAEIMQSVIIKGYTLVWDGDVSEKGFNHKKGVAEISDEETPSQENRQIMFNSWRSTDDHLMHIVGIAENGDGKKYFITKNSWAEDSNHFGGYLYMSEDYIRLHTVAIMVNRNSIPKNIATKLFKK